MVDLFNKNLNNNLNEKKLFEDVRDLQIAFGYYMVVPGFSDSFEYNNILSLIKNLDSYISNKEYKKADTVLMDAANYLRNDDLMIDEEKKARRNGIVLTLESPMNCVSKIKDIISELNV
ncbi:MAG: hypothetical protein O7C55_01035 [Rickettsia endosymbiont of Ixodes persulcatus]|nr:hypothetical protein [Rickettsia endosymbiont of Ixodes persulcatus]